MRGRSSNPDKCGYAALLDAVLRKRSGRGGGSAKGGGSLPRLASPPAVPVPLEQYAQALGSLFALPHLHPSIQRRRFREYLAGLLVPRDRNKTLTALVGAEPTTQAQTAPV
jgi:hypothetical protein